MGVLVQNPQFRDSSYDAALLAFLHLQERIDTMPELAQRFAWERVLRALSALPDPDLAEVLSLD